MLVAGDREAAEGTISVRHRTQGDIGSQRLEEFLEHAQQEIAAKAAAPVAMDAAR